MTRMWGWFLLAVVSILLGEFYGWALWAGIVFLVVGIISTVRQRRNMHTSADR